MNLTEQNRFEVGGEELLSSVQTKGGSKNLADGQEALDDIRVRVGTLLKTETVSFLLGAGASRECGGPLLGSVPIELERELQKQGIRGNARPQISQWLKLFYLAVCLTCSTDGPPITRDEILIRRDALGGGEVEPLKANFEQVLATLHRWRAALPEIGGHLRIDGSPPLDAKAKDMDEALNQATRALARACFLPVSGKESCPITHQMFVRKVLTRPLNLKRTNVFTLNYDTLIEQAADAEGVVLLDGFVGTQRRIFRPESYEQDLYFPAETTEGRVHRYDRVLHLYKLHGSITWIATEPSLDNPYGVEASAFDPNGKHPLLIYPTPAKYGETLGLPYSELFRRFAAAIVRPQSVLFVIGYGFGDDHVNAIIRQALAVPSFTLVIVDPDPKSNFVNTLREQRDRRVWVATGLQIGTLKGFVDLVLPDLRDEEIRKKVLATSRALTSQTTGQEESTNDD